MSQSASTQHPAVVLRSHYRVLRGLLGAAIIAIVGLSIAVALLATEERRAATPSAATDAQPASAGAVRYDGGPEEGTRGATVERSVAGSIPPRAAETRYDGGPEEGTRGATLAPSSPGTRPDGGPEEGTRGIGH